MSLLCYCVIFYVLCFNFNVGSEFVCLKLYCKHFKFLKVKIFTELCWNDNFFSSCQWYQILTFLTLVVTAMIYDQKTSENFSANHTTFPSAELALIYSAHFRPRRRLVGKLTNHSRFLVTHDAYLHWHLCSYYKKERSLGFIHSF